MGRIKAHHLCRKWNEYTELAEACEMKFTTLTLTQRETHVHREHNEVKEDDELD